MHDQFLILAVLLALAGVAGLIAVRLRQPLIIAFIGVGILAGPTGLNLVQPGDDVAVLSEVGIAVLLFLVGLKLDLRMVRSTGSVAILAGLGQVVATAALGFGLALALGLGVTTSLYVAIALTFSSTIIIVKLLSDERELEQQHGRLALGILIVQDIVVVLLMIVLTASGTTGNGTPAAEFGLIVVKGLGFLVAIGLAIRFVLPWLLHLVARSTELLVLFSVAWAVALAGASEALGFSTEVGAFLGGVAIATTPYREAIGARLVSLRDFLLLFFFVELGAGLAFDDAGAQVWRAAVLAVFVLVAKPLIIMGLLAFAGYRRRTSFLTGLVCAQISEFSLILVALGLSLGHLNSGTAGMVTLVGMATIGVSTYLILNDEALFRRLEPRLGRFERRSPRPDDVDESTGPVDVVLYGLGRYGGMVARELCASGVPFVAVESDPQRVSEWVGSTPPGMTVVYGDAEDIEFAHNLPLDHAQWVVSTIGGISMNLTLLHAMRREGFDGKVALTAHTDAEATLLREAGADIILQPFTDAADQVLAVIGHPVARERPGRTTQERSEVDGASVNAHDALDPDSA
jgi:Kef-type K+ transport system membrane component KefB